MKSTPDSHPSKFRKLKSGEIVNPGDVFKYRDSYWMPTSVGGQEIQQRFHAAGSEYFVQYYRKMHPCEAPIETHSVNPDTHPELFNRVEHGQMLCVGDIFYSPSLNDWLTTFSAGGEAEWFQHYRKIDPVTPPTGCRKFILVIPQDGLPIILPYNEPKG